MEIAFLFVFMHLATKIVRYNPYIQVIAAYIFGNYELTMLKLIEALIFSLILVKLAFTTLSMLQVFFNGFISYFPITIW